MDKDLDKTLKAIGADWEDKIYSGSRYYIEVDIGKKGTRWGIRRSRKNTAKCWRWFPLKDVESGMKVRIDGRTFINYAQLASGVAIPGHVIKKAILDYKAFVANDSMILNFI